MTSCPCRCHGQSSTFGACSVAGGCGHLHQAPDTEDPTLLCARGVDCLDARKRTVHNDDGSTSRVRIPARATAPNLLCRIDTSSTRSAIEQLPMDYCELHTILAKTTSVEPPTSGSRELTVPIRLGVAVHAEFILDELERWAEVVAADVGFWYHPAGGVLDRLRHAAGWVTGRYERLLTLPASWHQRLDPAEPRISGKDSSTWALESGLDGALRLLSLHDHTTEVAGRIRRAEHLYAPCPRCKRLALEHDEGASYVQCRRCTHRMPLDKYDEQAGTLARAYERSPRRRPQPAPASRPPAEQPIVWADGTRHTRRDTTSNVMLTYLARHDDRAAGQCA